MVSSRKDLKLLCNPYCDSQNLFRLGAAINFDRCAILASLHLPPAALGDEARHAVLERKARFQLSRVLKYSPPKIPHKNSTFRI